MKYDTRKKFRFELVKLLSMSNISHSPLREDFINLSWRKYKSQDSRTKLFDSFLEKTKYRDIRKKMLHNKTWGSYKIFMVDGDLIQL